MERLDIDDGFDLHAHREGLKLLKQDADTWQLQNRDTFACPACRRPFDRLYVTEDHTATFSSAPNCPICIARTPEQLLLFTHPTDG